MAEPLRVGLVGLGVIARFYRRALERSDSARLVAVCDRDPAALTAFGASPADTGPAARPAGAAPAVTAWPDHRALLAAGGLDALVVTVPNDAHAAICADALDAGLAVCVEKPLAIRTADADELARRAAATGGVLFTAFHRRYNAAVTALRDRLAAGPPVASLRIRYLERIEDHVGADRWYLDPARTGGGCVADNGPNAFDLAQSLVGELRVRAATIGRDAAGLDRTAVVELVAGEVPVRIELDWSFAGERKDVSVWFADGTRYDVDMLAGYDGFKASLWHEYEAVLADFVAGVGGAAHGGDGGPAALNLVAATYRAAAPVGAGEQR